MYQQLSPWCDPRGPRGICQKPPSKAYLIPWCMGQEKVTKFSHSRVPKEVRERTVHVKLWKTFIFNSKSNKHISSFYLLVLWINLHAWAMISVLAMSIYSIHYNPLLIIQLQHDVWLVCCFKCVFDRCSEIFRDHNNNSPLSVLNKHLRKRLKGKE